MSEAFGSLLRRRIIVSIIIGFGVLSVFKLFQMQVLHYIAYEEKSQTNSIKGIEQDPPRGIFFDRNMNVLVSNKPSFTLQIIPSQFDESQDRLIESVLGADSGYVSDILYKNRRFSKYTPRKIKRDINYQTVAWCEENSEKLPGVEYSVEMQRDYAFGVNGSHIFGYVKEVSANQLGQNKDIYSIGDYSGFKGLEKSYEKYLRGEKGINYFLVDSKQKRIGRYLDGKNDIPATKGNDLVLTIDQPTQKVAEEIFADKIGSVIAIEPATGEILAYVSAPDYDLSAFSAVTSEEVLSALQTDQKKPLFNRPTMSIIPPGSTFKMLLAIAGLEEGIIDENTKYYCAGGYQFGNRFFKCHGGVHKNINVGTAIEQSCNSFFYQLILKVGLDKWAEYAAKFGFGKKTGIDIDAEYRGILPDTEYYDRVFGKRQWTNGLLLNLAIGQGELSVTPIQLAQYVALIANNGKTYKPHFAKGYLDNKNQELVPFEYEELTVDIKQKSFDIIKKGMFDVVNGEGTAKWYKLQDIAISGKTGTAQNPHGEDHALFVAFAPFENPQIAVAVMVENVGFGSTHAAPVARDIIKTYLRNKNKIVPDNKIAKLDR